MTGEAVFRGTFSDFKLIKGRKVAQVVIEVPIEAADAALRALGGVPRADKEIWVAVARLDTVASLEPKPPKTKGSLTQQAAIACGDPRFHQWLREVFSLDFRLMKKGEQRTEEAALFVRDACKVKSRSEFDADPEAGKRWRELHGQFLAWCQL